MKGELVTQAIFLKAHLKLMALGMKNSQLSGVMMLNKTTAVTGNKYKRGQYTQAVEDLQKVIDKSKSDWQKSADYII